MRKLFYVLSVALGSGLLSFLVLVALGPLYENGEHWQDLALTWCFYGLPLIAIGAGCSVFIAGAYLRAASNTRRTAYFAANIAIVACIGFLPYLVMWIKL